MFWILVSRMIEEPKCDAGFFECQPNECITQAWVCDNQAVSWTNNVIIVIIFYWLYLNNSYIKDTNNYLLK